MKILWDSPLEIPLNSKKKKHGKKERVPDQAFP